ncbi:Nif3-like dinuclear metal center hexameric protein [Helicobacter sp. 12S02634-8]|uniref:Nif3-like dinuclear metal center hexameric protein n=1 Tax=Helicobacter sp. 12S02634-8 TaxID=1476199 RepID=UPI000BA75396|nr:Nif3-like dinuclear metal center hexameric protein [Helicobacter sp. 12S02634-8]PAF46542.1 Nif3-like dinuclear metal center hexameric protein [Helicobacter sp. 12S02634-8]
MTKNTENPQELAPSKSVSTLYDLLNTLSPFNLQESWDHSGLNLGSMQQDFTDIYVCLEVTLPIAATIPPKSLIISHHPLFFKPMQGFCYDTYPANIAKILIQKDCALISMHTNFDTTHLNAYFATEVLGFDGLHQDGIALSGAIEPIELTALVYRIKDRLGINPLRYTQGSSIIESVAIVCGAGSAYLYQNALKANSCLITGDIKYHDAMIARSLQISLIDVEHYQSEKFFPQIIKSILKTKGYQAIIKDCNNPFAYL